MKLQSLHCAIPCLFLAFTLTATLGAAQDAAAALNQATLAKAKAGDAASEFLVAIEYQKGDIVPRDFGQAAAWYRKAAEQGYAPAQYKLALLYQQKQSGIPQDDAQAAAWLRKAADQGNAQAQAALGQCFSTARGVAQDDAQAVLWYQKAVAQNNPDAMVGLATLYDRGRGVAKDGKQAFALLNQAAGLGSAEGEYELGIDFENGQDTKKDKNQAMDWYRKAAEQGHTWAEFNLGQMLASKPAEAYFWLSQATNHLEGDPLIKATVLQGDAAAKMKPADKAQAEDRVNQWHPTPAKQP
jgi:hypothetical protein